MRRLGDDAGQGLNRPARIALDVAGYGIGGVLAALAGARGAKAVHPHGVSYRGRLVIDGAARAPKQSVLLRTAGEYTALMRFSRSVGMPRPIPDLLGLSVRVLDAYGPDEHQDFLLVSSIDRPVLHHFFVPATDVQQRPYSSSLPFRAGDDTFLMGVLPDERSPRPQGDDEFDRLQRAAETGRLTFGLAIAPMAGRFHRVGSLHVGERLPQSVDALRFNPLNCGGGLQLTGVINRLRDYAYPLSQATWAHRNDGAIAQQHADAEVQRIRSQPDASTHATP